MRQPIPASWALQLLVIPAMVLVVSGCGRGSSPVASIAATPVASGVAGVTPRPSGAASPSAQSPSPAATGSPSPTDSGAPDTGGGKTSGDVPDNAVFLTYKGGTPAFAIQYVEGWQVTTQPDGVVIRDKDSSETVVLVAAQTDVKGYVASTDLPALQAQPGFKLDTQNTVKVGSTRLVHLVFHMPSPPDPVTGKQVPSTVDRYYVPGPAGLAIVSLSTPDGVDNVDAFRKMIESFTWS